MNTNIPDIQPDDEAPWREGLATRAVAYSGIFFIVVSAIATLAMIFLILWQSLNFHRAAPPQQSSHLNQHELQIHPDPPSSPSSSDGKSPRPEPSTSATDKSEQSNEPLTTDNLEERARAEQEVANPFNTSNDAIGFNPAVYEAMFTWILCLLAAIFSAGTGYLLLRTGGAATRQVIPRQDYALLSKLLIEKNQEALDSYVRLSSLSGFSGLFTKIGLTGLPLATIGLTIIFALLGLFVAGHPELFDLAKLTLGAFIGSYVQRATPEFQKEKQA